VTDYERWFEIHDALRGARGEHDHYMLGYLGTPLNPDPCVTRTDRRRSPWRHLFTIDYDEALGFEIPDGGWLQIGLEAMLLAVGFSGTAVKQGSGPQTAHYRAVVNATV
jgi:hypothetical protein